MAENSGGRIADLDHSNGIISNTIIHSNKALVTKQEHPPIPRLQTQTQKQHFFTAMELSRSITASERTRIICSILIALLGVLSYLDRPIIGINIVHSKSILALRPLYLLLVAEVTVLITHLVIERRKWNNYGKVEEDEDSRVLNAAGLNWERAVGILERGIVTYQIILGFISDCSVYVVIVVCGLSLGRFS